MAEDAEGFPCPVIIEELCVNCGLCKETCPALNLTAADTPARGADPASSPECYAVWADDITRYQTSSGGVFALAAYAVMERGGAVCGARFSDDFRSVYHTVIYDSNELWRLWKSKYVQSAAYSAFTEIKQLLDEIDKPVLFCGCPCQVAGLYAFLGKKHKNLYTIDLICHSVPSPKAWRAYLEERADTRRVKNVDFRCNHRGWGTDLEITFENGAIDYADWKGVYHRAFLEGVSARNSCYSCEYARLPRVGDLTLGDFWGARDTPELKKKYDDGKGTSLVLVNNANGKRMFEEARADMVLCDKIDLDFAVKTSWNLHSPQRKSKMRRCFFHHLDKDGFHGAFRYVSKEILDAGIVGWWYSKNYGSVLTYYSLYTFLQEKLGLSVKVVTYPGCYRYAPDEVAPLTFGQKRFAHTTHREKNSLYELNNHFDAFIIGSDQLWRYKNGFHNYYMLDFAHANKKKIAVAVSFGHDYCDFPEEALTAARMFAQRLDAVSVREQTGVRLAREYFGVDASCILDPVFYSDPRVFSELSEQAARKTEDGFVFAYLLDPNPDKVAAFKYISQAFGLKMVSITDMQFGPESRRRELRECGVFEAAVEEFLWHFQNAAFILTDSFHGTCFSILFNKSFLSIPNAARGNSRFIELLTKFEMLDRRLDASSAIKDRSHLTEPVDFTRANTILAVEREKSVQWIKDALSYKE
jgi:coenzyme F420-reducing hydrogenase beta subunit